MMVVRVEDEGEDEGKDECKDKVEFAFEWPRRSRSTRSKSRVHGLWVPFLMQFRR